MSVSTFRSPVISQEIFFESHASMKDYWVWIIDIGIIDINVNEGVIGEYAKSA